MAELTPEEVDEALYAPKTIFAPNGTSFVVQMKYDASTPEQVLSEEGWLSYDITGPLGEANHKWIADGDGELMKLPSNDDVPRAWSIMAEVALQGWLRLTQELGDAAIG